MLSGMGQAGERSTGKRDVDAEVKLPLWQSVVMVIIALVAAVAVLVMGGALGRWGVYAVSVILVWMYIDQATEWASHQTRNAQMIAAIYAAETWLPWAWMFCGIFVSRVLMPFEWAFNVKTWEHFLVLLKYDDLGREINKLIDVSILVRVGVEVVGVSVLLATGVAWRHFRNELDAYYPMKAIDPSAAGSDPREWKRRRKVEEKPTSVTVHIETVMRGKAADVGAKGVFPGDQIVYSDIAATRAQWELVTSAALRRVSPTEGRMTETACFSATEWRAMRDGMIGAGLIEAQGNGEHGANAGYDFTDAGREFFKRRKWDRGK